MKILVTSANTESTISNVCKEQIGDFEVDFICYNKTKIRNNRKNSLHPRLLGKIPKMLAIVIAFLSTTTATHSPGWTLLSNKKCAI